MGPNFEFFGPKTQCGPNSDPCRVSLHSIRRPSSCRPCFFEDIFFVFQSFLHRCVRKELLCWSNPGKSDLKRRDWMHNFFSRANVYLSLRAPSSSSSLMKWGVRSPFLKTLLSLQHLLVAVSFNRFRNRGTWKGWKIGVVPRFYSL